MAVAVSSKSSTANWRNLPLLHSPSNEQLAQMQLNLDVLFLALVALADLHITTVHLAIQELGLQHLCLNSPSSNSLAHPKYWRASSGEVLSLEEARSLVLLVCHLAQKHQELLRRAVTLMEQMEEQGKEAAKTVLLGNYLDNFQELYRGYRHTEGVAQKHQELLRRAVTLKEQMEEQGKEAAKTVLLGNYLDNFQELYRGYRHTEGVIDPLDWQHFSFKQLIDLLFYGAKNGDRRLWLVLIENK